MTPAPIPRHAGPLSCATSQRPRRAGLPLIWGSYIDGYTLETEGYAPMHYPSRDQADAVLRQIVADEALVRTQARLLAVAS